MRRDLYVETTATIIRQMEQGTLPWVKPWKSAKGVSGAALPISVTSGKPYSGVNILLLWGSQIDRGYGSNRWLTYKTAAKLGGHVRKGETGTMVVYADKFIPKGEKAKAAETGETARNIYFLKPYYVFNSEQCEGLPSWDKPEAPIVQEGERSEAVEACIAATGAKIVHGTGGLHRSEAFYSPSHDYISLPVPAQFPNLHDYYATAFHELGHWTGHASRLDRKFGGKFGDTAYAREELVAEMTAAFACAHHGISPRVRHSDYLASWLSVLKEDSRAIFQAASKASKACEFVLAGKVDETQIIPEPIAA